MESYHEFSRLRRCSDSDAAVLFVPPASTCRPASAADPNAAKAPATVAIVVAAAATAFPASSDHQHNEKDDDEDEDNVHEELNRSIGVVFR